MHNGFFHQSSFIVIRVAGLLLYKQCRKTKVSFFTYIMDKTKEASYAGGEISGFMETMNRIE